MFVGNINPYNELLGWLRNGKGVCLLSGPTGCGKTYGVHEAAKTVGREITLFDSSTCFNGKDFKDKFIKATRCDVMAQLTNTADGQRLIFIDELDALLTIDRTFLLNLKSLPDNIQVVIAGTGEAIRRVGIHIDICIDICEPKEGDILNMLKDYKTRKSLKVPIKELSRIASTCDGNIAIAIRNLAKICEPKVKKKGSGSGVQVSGEVEIKMDHFGDIVGVYRDPKRVAYDVLLIDPWLNVLRYHENIIHELEQRVFETTGIREVYVNTMKDLCDWVFMMGWSPEIAVQFIAISCVARLSLPLKPKAQPPTTRFTKMINIMSARKKGLNYLYATTGKDLAFPWHQVGSMEKSFLSKR